jgi:hypothetical protein
MESTINNNKLSGYQKKIKTLFLLNYCILNGLLWLIFNSIKIIQCLAARDC